MALLFYPMSALASYVIERDTSLKISRCEPNSFSHWIVSQRHWTMSSEEHCLRILADVDILEPYPYMSSIQILDAPSLWICVQTQRLEVRDMAHASISKRRSRHTSHREKRQHLVVCGAINHLDGFIFSSFMGLCMALTEQGVGARLFLFSLERHPLSSEWTSIIDWYDQVWENRPKYRQLFLVICFSRSKLCRRHSHWGQNGLFGHHYIQKFSESRRSRFMRS